MLINVMRANLLEIDLAVATKSIFRIRQLAIAFSECVVSHHDYASLYLLPIRMYQRRSFKRFFWTEESRVVSRNSIDNARVAAASGGCKYDPLYVFEKRMETKLVETNALPPLESTKFYHCWSDSITFYSSHRIRKKIASEETQKLRFFFIRKQMSRWKEMATYIDNPMTATSCKRESLWTRQHRVR